MDNLEQQIKELIVEQLRLEIAPSSIQTADPIFGEVLGLDSIDALELIVGLEKKFGLKVSDQNEWRKILYSVETLANYLQKQLAEKSE